MTSKDEKVIKRKTHKRSVAYGGSSDSSLIGFGCLGALLRRAAECERDIGITFVEDFKKEKYLSYKDVYEKAKKTLCALNKKGVRQGDFVILSFRNNDEFVSAFWACILGGITPSPVAIPSALSQKNDAITKLANVIDLLNKPYVMSDVNLGSEEELNSVLSLPIGKFINSKDMALETESPRDIELNISPEDIAFIQFSSGSTGKPKGVTLTHKNLLINLEGIIEGLRGADDDKYLSWMPYHHDMGLIGFHLTPIAQLVNQINIPSFKFVQRPMLWMNKANEHRATITSSPNFGYSHFLEKFKDEIAKDWDLSCIRLIFNGAEPISAQVMTRFMNVLECKGLKQAAMYPVYGMAEASLAVTFPGVGELPEVHNVDRILLANKGKVKFVNPDHRHAMEVVDLGGPIPGVDIRIVSNKDGVVGEGRIGHVQIRGGNVTGSYYNNEEANEESYVGDWLRTGDLGFIWNSRLVVTGRAKDIIFINGQNFFAYDLEVAAELEPFIQPGKVAACGWTDHETQKEKVALFVSIKIPSDSLLSEKDVLKRIGERVNEIMGFPLDYIIAVKSVPKTSSGKVQRYRLLQEFLDGKFSKNSYRFRELMEFVGSKSVDSDNVSTIVDKIRLIWASALERSAADIDSAVPFLKQGGTSIKAIKVMDQLEDVFDLELGHEILLSCQTVDAMVEYIKQQLTGRSSYKTASVTKIASHKPIEGDIAVISMACRFPSADNAEEFWQHIRDGNDLVKEVPADRWQSEELYDLSNTMEGGVTSCWGAFLDEAYNFDANFFGISEKEAITMDPQQRLVMMLCREALDSSGYDESKEGFGKVGVFVGASFNNYMESFIQSLILSQLKRFESFNKLNDESRQKFIEEWKSKFGQPTIEQYTVVDNLLNMISARTSQELNLKGPSFTVDSACSSSLVALHMACESIRRGESDMALAGGINLLLTPTPYQMFSRSGALSPNGRCKVFDAQADGFVPGEGGGIVLLKPLDQAIKDRDVIHGVIKGSWVNNDGRSIGVMSPNPDGQRVVIEETYRRFNLSPANISYMEAHGTGTVIGDHSEIRALKQAFSYFSSEKSYCAIGSVKANVGHLLSAAGIVSFFKVLMAMKHQKMPPSINISQVNNSLGFDNSPFYLVKELSEWKIEEGKNRCAAINSFGFGGTNCHLVVEQGVTEPVAVTTKKEDVSQHIICLSGNDQESIKRQASVMYEYLESHPGENLSDIAYTLNARRRHYNYRDFLISSDRDELQSSLKKLCSSDKQHVSKRSPKVVFMFTGQGAQYPGMGREMYASNACFRHYLDAVLCEFDKVADLPLREVILNLESSKNIITDTKVSQPAIFAINYALAQALLEWGVKPDYVLGHSLGEYVSACIAGVMSLEDAVSIVAMRGQLMSDLPNNGGMLAIFTNEKDVTPVVAEYLGHLSVAAYNGTHVVVSGEKEALEEISSYFLKRNVTVKSLAVSHAFHSPLMEFILEPFREVLDKIIFNSPIIPIVSNVYATVPKNEKFDQSYWLSHVTAPVRFDESLKYLASNHGSVAYVEIGPKPTLTALAKAIVGENDNVSIMSTLAPKANGNQVLLNVVGQLYRLGVDIDWPAIYSPHSHKLVTLPPYSFNNKTYRITQAAKSSNTIVVPNLNERLWRPVGKSSTEKALPKGPILVFCDEVGVYKEVLRSINGVGDMVIKVFSGSCLERDAEGNYKINKANSSELSALMDDLLSSNMVPVEVVYLWSCDEERTASYPRVVGNEIYKELSNLIFVFKSLSQKFSKHVFGLTVVTKNSFSNEVDFVSPMARVLSTWVAAASVEVNNIVCKTLDLSSLEGCDKSHINNNYRSIIGEKMSGEYRMHNGKLLKSVWVLRSNTAMDPEINEISNGDTIIITGGAAGVGYKLAEAIARKSIVNLVLTGRQAIPPVAEWEHASSSRVADLKKLMALGCQVYYQDVDVADRGKMQLFLESIRLEFGRIDGVIHAAGIVDKTNVLVDKKTSGSIKKVLSPKVEGTLCLDYLTRQDQLKFFITLSSISSTERHMGAGLSDYAAANAFLDAYPDYRSDASGRTITLNWPLWKGCGMGQEQWIVNAVEQRGVATVTADYGVKVFEYLLKNASSGTYYIGGESKHLSSTHSDVARSELPKKTAVSRSENAVKYSEPSEINSTAILKKDILEVLCQVLSLRLNIPTVEISTTSNFVDLGVDSVMAVDFINDLSKILGKSLYPTLLFEYQTLESLAGHLREHVCTTVEQHKVAAEVNKETTQHQRLDSESDIAIIGMACRFPGAASVDQYWSNLCQAKSFIRDVPQGRWSSSEESLGTLPIKRGGFIDTPYDFEPMFFGISPKEAEAMDPQQRIFLEVAWLGLQNAGYVAEDSTKNIGVYVGCEHNNYSERFVAYLSVEKLRRQLSDSAMFPDLKNADRKRLFDMFVNILSPGEVSSDTVAGNGMNIVAARVNQSLNLTGPALSINTACSSSLVSVHMACDGLRNGDAEMAIAGGVCLNTSATPYALLNYAKALSPDGTCAPFDKSANGMVLGEGAGALILKPLSKAQQDGDMIYAVIKGSAINNDGRSNGITAPKPDGQARAIRAAYEKSGVAPESVSYVECHGTATNLGDPVELQGMTQAFRTFTDKSQFCAIGSVKSSIGHLLSASGVASVIKVASMLQKMIIPPVVGYKEANPYIDFNNSPFYVADSLQPWLTGGKVRRAGINAFGFGGTNCHLILEEAPEVRCEHREEPSVVCMSARSDEALYSYIKELSRFVENTADLNLSNLAFSLSVGQKDFRHRCAVVVNNREDLRKKLHSISQQVMTGAYKGFVPNKPPKVSILLSDAFRCEEHSIARLREYMPELSRRIDEWQRESHSYFASLASKERVGQLSTLYVLIRLLDSLGVAASCVRAASGSSEELVSLSRLISRDMCLSDEEGESIVNKADVVVHFGSDIEGHDNNVYFPHLVKNQSVEMLVEVLAALYSKGLNLYWNFIFSTAQRISIPGYVFDRKFYQAKYNGHIDVQEKEEVRLSLVSELVPVDSVSLTEEQRRQSHLRLKKELSKW